MSADTSLQTPDVSTTSPPSRRSRPRVALVLGSGGLKCVAAVGLWKVLEREGVPIDLYVGCSGGSVYASVMATGMDAKEGARVTPGLWQRSVSAKVRYSAMLRMLLPRLFPIDETFGLLDDRPLLSALQEVLGDHTFANVKRPLYLAATDAYTGERVLVSEGRLVDAVRASLAIPLVFSPWRVNGRLLTDGGSTDPLPISVAIRERADLIIAMGFENPLHERLDSIPAIAAQTSTIAMNSLIRSTYAFYNAVHHAEIIPILPSFEQRVSLRRTELIPHIIQEGERAAELAMPHILRSLANMEPAGV